MAEKNTVLTTAEILTNVTLGIAGLLLTIYIHKQSTFTNHQIEEIKTELSKDQLIVNHGEFAAKLIDPLINGSESEKLISMIILESVNDTLAREVIKGLALFDEHIRVRVEAIKALGRLGNVEDVQTLKNIEKKAKTKTERQVAKEAEGTIALREKLNNAQAFYEEQIWETSARYFFEALSYANPAMLNTQQLAIAKSYYEHGDYQNAANAFYQLFF